jgi:c-di-GMP-binding flagellar brake protein YcgR
MPNADLHIERRQFPRVQRTIPIRFRVIDDQKELATLMERRKRDQKSETIDLSEGGVFMTAPELMTVGSIIRLDIQLGGAPDALSAFAEVVWANESGCGLRFLAMKEEDAAKLKTFIESAG